MKRFDCMQILVSKLAEDSIVVSTLANTAHMLQKLRPSDANFFPLNLGCCTATALGLALALPHRRIVALDSDGNMLLNLSVLPDLANQGPPNLGIVVFDNEAYDASGGLPSATAGKADIAALAKAAGIDQPVTCRSLAEFEQSVEELLNASETAFLVAKVEKDGQFFNPPTPYNFQENKFRFVRYIEKTEGVTMITRLDHLKVIL